jgi:hypothetical protein
VDTQTRHALKKDNFALATATSVSWLSGHRSAVLSWGIAAVAVVVVGAAALIYWNIRSSAAEAALGAAMDVYTSPLGQPGAPAAEGVYTTASDRTKTLLTSMAGCPREPKPTILPASRMRIWARMLRLRAS